MKIAVIGAGSWGTALANQLAGNGHNVSLWARRPEVVTSINKEHRNPRYLSDVRLHDDVVATLSHRDAVLRARAAVIVTPSNLLRGVARALADCVDPDFPVIICSKGVEEGSGLLPNEVFEAEMGNGDRIAVLCHGKITGLVDAAAVTKEQIGLMMTGATAEEVMEYGC